MNVITVLHTNRSKPIMEAAEILNDSKSLARIALEEYVKLCKNVPVGYCITSCDQWFCDEQELIKCDRHMEEE